MSKILATQLNGLYQKIVQNEEDSIEQTARLLAQASVGEGNVYFACFDELQAIELYALNSEEQPFSKLSKWTPDVEIQEADRVLIFAKSAQHPEALQLAKKLYDEFIPFAVVAGEAASDDNEMSNLAYTYISTHVRGGLIPHPTKLGERVVVPHLHAALFVYEAIKLVYDEILEDEM